MNGANAAHPTSNVHRFSLRNLLEYVSICAVLAAFASQTGVVSLGLLMGLGLALSARLGFVALAMLMGASLASNGAVSAIHPEWSMQRELLVLALGSCVVAWYRFRRRVRGRSGRSSKAATAS